MGAVTAGVFVPGTPVPQGSAKAFSVAGRVRVMHSNGARLNPWRADIAVAVDRAIGGAVVFPNDEPVALSLAFVMPRTKGERKDTRPHTRRPDCDKLQRGVIDALQGLVYADDSQVVEIHAHKRTAELGEYPGVAIEWELA